MTAYQSAYEDSAEEICDNCSVEDILCANCHCCFDCCKCPDRCKDPQ